MAIAISTLALAILPETRADEAEPPLATADIGSERVLKRESAKILEVRHNQLGQVDPTFFLTFEEQKAVIVLHVGNDQNRFFCSARIAVFAEDADSQSIAKWVNNQHSCGLFVDPAEPVFVEVLPEGTCTAKGPVAANYMGSAPNIFA